MTKKNVTLLRPADFREHPIWMPTDDPYDEDEVSPCNVCDSIPLEGVYYVAARFRLPDKSSLDGFIRISEGDTVALAIEVNAEEFVYYSLSLAIRNALGDTQSTFSNKIGRTGEQVFPLEYQAQCHFTNHIPIRGSIV